MSDCTAPILFCSHPECQLQPDGLLSMCVSVSSCDDGNPCTTDSCSEILQMCTHTPVADGVACSDLSGCTVGACNAGACQVTGPAADGSPCDDGNACTLQDVCYGGTCYVDPTGGLLTCNQAANCFQGLCDPAHGCTYLAIAQCWDPALCAACDDADPCTDDGCDPNNPLDLSACVHQPTVCDDLEPCTTDWCDSAAGGCQHQSLADGTTCDDGNPCTDTDQCVSAHCQGTFPAGGQSSLCCNVKEDCDASGICGAAVDCLNGACIYETPGAPSGVPGSACCTSGLNCPPNDACTLSNGVCTAANTCDYSSVQMSCTTASPCTIATCDPNTGACVTSNVSDGQPCEDGDGNGCTGECQGGACVSEYIGDQGWACCSAQSDCDDGNPCTTDVGCTIPAGQTMGTCANILTPSLGCCATDMDCDDGDPGTTDTCSNMGGGAYACDPSDSITPCDLLSPVPSACVNAQVTCTAADPSACFRGSNAPYLGGDFSPATPFVAPSGCYETTCTNGVCSVPTAGDDHCLDELDPTNAPFLRHTIFLPCAPSSSPCNKPRRCVDVGSGTTELSVAIPSKAFCSVPQDAFGLQLCMPFYQAGWCAGLCTGDWQCADGMPWTLDSCNPGTGNCSNTPNSGPCVADWQCDDGLPGADTCAVATGQCSGTVNAGGACDEDVDCDDGSAQTLDRCISGACVSAPHGPYAPCGQDSDCVDVDVCMHQQCQQDGRNCSDGPAECANTGTCALETASGQGHCANNPNGPPCNVAGDCGGAECLRNFCSQSSTIACSTNLDCPPAAGACLDSVCRLSGAACSASLDCPWDNPCTINRCVNGYCDASGIQSGAGCVYPTGATP